jgi:hypothetical protein
MVDKKKPTVFACLKKGVPTKDKISIWLKNDKHKKIQRRK